MMTASCMGMSKRWWDAPQGKRPQCDRAIAEADRHRDAALAFDFHRLPEQRQQAGLQRLLLWRRKTLGQARHRAIDCVERRGDPAEVERRVLLGPDRRKK